MSKKTWKDQPDIVTEARIVCGRNAIQIRDGLFLEIRQLLNGQYLLTAGNLFGSQTVLCETADAVFAVMNTSREKNPTLPRGAELVPNERES